MLRSVDGEDFELIGGYISPTLLAVCLVSVYVQKTWHRNYNSNVTVSARVLAVQPVLYYYLQYSYIKYNG